MFVNKKVSLNSFMYFSIILCLGLYILNFFEMGDFVIMAVFFPLLLRYLLGKNKTKNFFMLFGLLVVLLISYVGIVSTYKYDSTNALIRIVIFPISMLLLGYQSLDVTLDKSVEDIEIHFYMLISFLVFFMSLYGFLAFVKTSIIYGGYSQARIAMGYKRYVISFWGNELLTATGVTTYLGPSLALLPIGLFLPWKNYTIPKVLLLTAFAMATFVNISLGNRTGIIIIAFSVGVTTIILFVSKKLKKGLLFILFIIMFLFVFTYLTADTNNVINLIEKRFVNESLSEDSRFTTWMYVLSNFAKLPLGGRAVALPNGLNYSHNFFLDILYFAGYLPLLFSLMFIYQTIKVVISFDKVEKNGVGLTLYLLFFGFILVFMVEPILQGWIISFSCFCFFMGISQRFREIKSESYISNHQFTKN